MRYYRRDITKVTGEFNPANGMRFNENRLLMN